MKNIALNTFLISISFFCFECAKEKTQKSPEILIQTGKNLYVVNHEIDISITNQSAAQANYFTCDNVDLPPSKLLMFINDQWTEYDYPVVCTAMGPAGFNGVLKISETKKDTLIFLSKVGRFKIRYKFIVDQDTVNFDSNEITLLGLVR